VMSQSLVVVVAGVGGASRIDLTWWCLWQKQLFGQSRMLAMMAGTVFVSDEWWLWTTGCMWWREATNALYFKVVHVRSMMSWLESQSISFEFVRWSIDRPSFVRQRSEWTRERASALTKLLLLLLLLYCSWNLGSYYGVYAIF
jgi:hypothetical protein